RPDIVPVGKDQIQHVEIARDIAIKFNNEYGEVFKIPEFRIQEEVATVPGTDGQKMSKSYGNTVNIFGEEKAQLKTIKKIVTENVAMEEPKEYENCNVYNMAKLFLSNDELRELQNRYKKGGEGHGHFKLYLADVMWEYFGGFREKRSYYEANQDEVREILNAGALKAKEIALPMIEKIRSATGIKY
ncbi:tryptophan--tRNA ligase, partial [bacterium]|nr:tryptophan--tRNA ligase [bacterium]